jgi:hypothetical protein
LGSRQAGRTAADEILGKPSGPSAGCLFGFNAAALVDTDHRCSDRHAPDHIGRQQDFLNLYSTINIRYFITTISIKMKE